MRILNMLTLSEAVKTNRIKEFIDQEEKRGIGPADRRKLNAAIRKLAIQPLPKDRTSRSSSGDDLSGK
jgi:hypothetical protein